MGSRTVSKKQWKLAGTPVVVRPLSREDELLVSAAFQVYHSEYFREYCRRHPEMQIPASTAKLREGSARAALSAVCTSFQRKYDHATVVEVFSSAVALPVQQTEEYAAMPSVLMGAAVWLLDELEGSEGWEELQRLLPAEVDDELEYSLPYVEDFSHPHELMYRLVTLLLYRESDHRREYRRVLELLAPERKAELRRIFRDAALDYLGRVLELGAARPASPPPALRPAPPAPGLLSPKEFAERSRTPGMTADVVGRENERPELYLLMDAPALIGQTKKVMGEELRSRKAAELLFSFRTEEPYALCAAYLLLEWEKDALAYWNTITGAVMACAERHLPWAHADFILEEPVVEKGRPDYTLCYELDAGFYTADEGEEEPAPAESGELASEAQLFYMATGHIPPRGRVPSSRLLRWLLAQHLPEGTARELARVAMVMWYKERDWDQFLDGFDFSDEGIGVETAEGEAPIDVDEGNTEVPTAEPETAAPTERVAELTKREKELRRLLHDSEQAAKALSDKLGEAKRRAEADRAELTQLRDALFRIKSEEECEAAPQELTVALPFLVKRRVSVFGGHDTWRKVIRPLLPGVRFCDRESLPDLDAVRNSDSVWVQANAISHKYYYRVINTARTSGIPVHYFGFASAKKCAEQLVMDELLHMDR